MPPPSPSLAAAPTGPSLPDARPVPAMPPRPARRLSIPQLLRTAATNTLAVCDEELFEKPIVARWYGLQRAVFVSDPATIKDVLVDRFDDFPRVSSIRRLFEIEVGTGTLGSEGETWWRHRRVATPTLDHRALKPDVPGLIAIAEEQADNLQAGPGSPPLELESTLYNLSAPMWNHIVAGGDPAAVPILHWLSKVPRKPRLADIWPKPKWLADLLVKPAGDPRTAALDTQLRAMVAARRREDYDGPHDLLYRLSHSRDRQTGTLLPDGEVRDEAASLIAGGGSTVVRALTWLFYLLALHPDVEERFHAEIDTLLGDQPLRPDQMNALPYARRVFDEVMRLYPPIPAIMRQSRRMGRVGGAWVPPGAIIAVMPWIVHRHRALWTDPDRFDPDRFSPEASAGRPRYAYIPFALGPRVCVGATFATLHLTALAVAIARRYRVRLAQPDRPVVPFGAISLQPRGGMLVTLERRRG